jgi:diguanylate cyclase (GGDEF)-like protein/PAS domain S-box-containing protein
MTSLSRLLIVDDVEQQRNILSRRLVHRGYDVMVAAEGQEALALIAAGTFDLVLLDIEMPGVGGLEVLTQIRRTRAQTELPVIMVTGRTEGDEIVEAFRLGANDYVTKPIDFAVACARIGTHLSHKRSVERLRDSEERYALSVTGANDGLWDWNLVTNQVYWSPRWKAMLGYTEPEIGASPDEWLSRVHPEDRARVSDALAAHLEQTLGHYECEHRMLHRDGTFRWVLCRGAAVRNHLGAATRLAGSLTDVTDTKVADALTGLPNRLMFIDLLDRAIKRTERHSEYLFALLVLGLDRFNAVSDSWGPLTADRLLVAVARRLQTSLRSTDAVTRADNGVTLARLGGDKFMVLLDDIADGNDAARVAERLRLALLQPFEVEGRMVFASASVGIAVSSTGYQQPDDILRDATTALHRAKTDGPSRCELFDTAMRDRAVLRLQTETDLRAAIEQSAFEIHYQPIISLQTGRLAAFEALARWRHPKRGLVTPIDFISIAEDTGLILNIGRFMLRDACRQMAAWQVRFGERAPERMCVNVSSRQFVDATLADDIQTILRQSGLPASSLKLEITESAFLRDLPAAQAILNTVRLMGVEWSLDDFGTGYSSLSYLHQLRVNTVKIDRTFVHGIGDDKNGTEMVRAIVGLAHNLGMDVVAEGVETGEQLEQVRALGCEFAQGYYFSKPVDATAATNLIVSQPWDGQLVSSTNVADPTRAIA